MSGQPGGPDTPPPHTATLDLSAVNAQLQAAVAAHTLPGVSHGLLLGGQAQPLHCIGPADREAGMPTPVLPDTIFRAFSNTKLITSLAVLRLHDAGHFGLDDPIAAWVPEFAALRVLRPGATALDDTEPLATPITIRHLLSHQSGLSHGVFDPGTLLFDAYLQRGVRRTDTSLAELMAIFATLPLNFQPGTAWDYSAASDVLARLVEVVSGQSFGDHLRQQMFQPLGLDDTGFVLRPDQVPRFAALYGVPPGADELGPCSQRLVDRPYPGAWLRPVPRQSGAGGLFTTLPDMLAVLRCLLPRDAGGHGWLREATRTEVFRNQLPAGTCVRFAQRGALPHLGFGLAGALTLAEAGPLTPTAAQGALGTLQWGGLAGTHWWVAPNAVGGRGLAGALMTQRMMGFWHPFWFHYQRAVHAALPH
jgi:CubicO group peptidase (beta-lactamase class C family)